MRVASFLVIMVTCTSPGWAQLLWEQRVNAGLTGGGGEVAVDADDNVLVA